MEQALMTVRCVCGWEVTGTEDEVVSATDAHGQGVHNMSATREQILAMAVPLPEPTATSQAAPGA